MGDNKKIVVVSDAAPLIQLALSHHLEMLPRLYKVAVPTEVFEETQHYRELPDAMEIAKASGKWLLVRTVKDKKRVDRLMQERLGEGEAEAMVLYQEIRADSFLTSDRYASSKAAGLGLKTITVGDVIKEAYNKKVISAPEAVGTLDDLIGQDILNTGYLRQLLREAREWP